MSYAVNSEQAKALFSALAEKYTLYAPKRFPKQGRYSDTDVIRYAPVARLEEIVFDEKSDYPAKEVLSPIHQALFYFTEDEFRASKAPKKPILLFARPCDINAQRIQARIYAGNGGFTDAYYERMHQLVKFVLMECPGGDDTCFCVSMGTNQTDDWSLAVRRTETGCLFSVVDGELAPYFSGLPEAGFAPAFVQENQLKVTIPDIPDKETLNALKKHPFWKEFNSRCISCGSCTVACSTCTCFTTRDIIYGDNPEVGERRRVTASCQVEGFDQMAGQREFRSTAGERMRYKVLHKFHDYNARFGEGHMCVGCGRCTHRCPELISISATVNKMSAALAEIRAEQAKEGGSML